MKEETASWQIKTNGFGEPRTGKNRTARGGVGPLRGCGRATGGREIGEEKTRKKILLARINASSKKYDQTGGSEGQL